MLLGCLVRIVYISFSDLNSNLIFGYVLRAINDCLWLTAFSVMAFFWFELMTGKMKKRVMVEENKPKMIASVAVYSLFRCLRVIFEITNIKAGVLTMKSFCGIFLIVLFAFAMFWGVKLLSKMQSINPNKRRASAVARNSTDTAFGYATTERSSRSSTSIGEKENEAAVRFRFLLVAEGSMALIALLEHVVSIILAETGAVSLNVNPGAVFALKIVQRGTEYLMMFLLVYLVCLKTQSRNLMLPRIPWMCFSWPKMSRDCFTPDKPHEVEKLIDAEMRRHDEVTTKHIDDQLELGNLEAWKEDTAGSVGGGDNSEKNSNLTTSTKELVKKVEEKREIRKIEKFEGFNAIAKNTEKKVKQKRFDAFKRMSTVGSAGTGGGRDSADSGDARASVVKSITPDSGLSFGRHSVVGPPPNGPTRKSTQKRQDIDMV